MAKSNVLPITDLTGPAPAAKPKPRRRPTAAKAKPAPTSAAPEPVAADESAVPASTPHRHPALIIAGLALGVILLAITSFEALYSGRILPGLTVDGVDVDGLTPAAAAAKITAAATIYNRQALTITYANSDLRIPVSGLAPTYDATHATQLAVAYGRTGNLLARAHQQLRALLGRATIVTAANFDSERLMPYLSQLNASIATPVQNATLTFDGTHASVTPAATGTRLDLGQLTGLIADRLSTTSTEPVAAPVYQLDPALATPAVQTLTQSAAIYLTGPLTLTYAGGPRTVDQATLVSWLQVTPGKSNTFLSDLNLVGVTPPPTVALLGLSHGAITNYVASLASQLDQPAKNATLAMQNNQLAITVPSQNGVSLDQVAAISAITASVTRPAADRTISLNLTSAPAAVNENNLASLGITDLISEGETYFPGSPADRLINVRTGAAKFNDVLLAPGEQFSFGKILGAVDASTGYVPELVIDGNHEDYQYGGGLCQVSTTAFRAALLAGLPINERVNHAFAISYYTWPYGVPGVDATIYYPEVDFKFTNDTGHYILMQTIMQGVDLKFDFYGTKTKQGVIRGPQFISGSNDAKQPSKTVFYRDVEDLSGNVLKTNTFYTSYQSSANFPIVKTFN